MLNEPGKVAPGALWRWLKEALGLLRRNAGAWVLFGLLATLASALSLMLTPLILVVPTLLINAGVVLALKAGRGYLSARAGGEWDFALRAALRLSPWLLGYGYVTTKLVRSQAEKVGGFPAFLDFLALDPLHCVMFFAVLPLSFYLSGLMFTTGSWNAHHWLLTQSSRLDVSEARRVAEKGWEKNQRQHDGAHDGEPVCGRCGRPYAPRAALLPSLLRLHVCGVARNLSREINQRALTQKLGEGRGSAGKLVSQ